MRGAHLRLLSHPLVVVVLTTFSTLVAGVPRPSQLPCPNAGDNCIVHRQDSGTGEQAVKPRSGEDSEKSEEEETSPEFDVLVELASAVVRGDDTFSYVSVVDGTIGDRQHSPKSSIRGPPAA